MNYFAKMLKLEDIGKRMRYENSANNRKNYSRQGNEEQNHLICIYLRLAFINFINSLVIHMHLNSVLIQKKYHAFPKGMTVL